MKQQNYSNHTRWVPGYHFFTALMLLGLFLYTSVRLVRSLISQKLVFGHLFYYCVLPFLIVVCLIMLFWYSRVFALAAQDRAIRAEETMRYFILTGKPIDSRITMKQIIALRFASDEEFPALVQEAATKNLSGSDIKKSIKNWRADNHRA